MPTDEELFTRWSAGDRAAGDAFIRRLFEPVRRFLASKVGAEVEELAQLTFSRVLEARERFEGRSSAKSFVLGVARNVIREHYRHRARAPVDVEEHSVADLGAGPSTLRWRRREDEHLLTSLRMLPLHMQSVLELYYWEQLNAREIAEVLEVPEGTVASRLRRAKERLRGIYEGTPATAEAAEGSPADPALEQWAERLRGAVPLDPRTP